MLSQYISTTIETKALCSVLRKAELKGTEALVDTMIEICDTQSGIMLQDLWEWWKKHKQKDQSTFGKQIKECYDKRIQEMQDRMNPSISDPNRITVVC